MTLTIDKEFRSLIPPLSAEELAQLEANLVAEGCREKLVTWQGLLLDGHNRKQICDQYGIEYSTTEQPCADRDAAKVWIIRNQFGRRNLSPFQRAELALKLEPLISEKVKAKQASHTKQGYQKSGKADRTDKEVARTARVSHDTIHKAKKIVEHASEPVKAKLRRGETTINKEYKAIIKAERRTEQVAAVANAKPITGKFNVIVADPPWNYDSRAADATHRAANPYPSMSIDAIKLMPVGKLSTADCILWLWTTNAFIVQAHEVAETWGFKVKTILTWAKDRMGTGDWLRGQTEHCLMGVRGKPVVKLTNQTTLLQGPMREHSRKPDEFYALVESLCPGQKCELFSRQDRDGWTAAGSEVGKFAA